MINPERPNEPSTPAPHARPADTQEFDAVSAVSAADKANDRRALWITVAAVAALVAVAVPVIMHFVSGNPPRLHTPAQLAGLNRDNQSDAADTANYLQNAIAAGMGLENAVGAVYTDGRGDAHSVIFVGGATSDGGEDKRLTRLFGLLNDATDGLTAIAAQPAGSLGGTVKCGLATDTGSNRASTGSMEMAVCGWADRDTVGIAMFPNRPLAEAATLLRQMRPAIQGKR
jgi:hypothetical protein